MVWRWRNMFYGLLIMFIVIISYILYKGYKNTQDVAVNYTKLGNPSSHSPTIRILHVSDMHLENISITPDQLYKKISDKQVDLIALTGDFLDRKWTIPKLIPYLNILKKLQPTYGAYVVFGNHDYVLRERNFKKLKEVFHEHGFKTLQNEREMIEVNGKAVNIIGIDDFSTGRSDLVKSYQNVGEGYHLVLTHDPNIVLHMAEHRFDYLLSGHFHGGQIHWPKPYHLVKMGKLARMKMVKGLHHFRGAPFYISEGLGQTGINIRFGSQPEITYHDIVLDDVVKKEAGEATIAG